MSNWYVYRIHADEINFMTSTAGARRRARLINMDTWAENKQGPNDIKNHRQRRLTCKTQRTTYTKLNCNAYDNVITEKSQLRGRDENVFRPKRRKISKEGQFVPVINQAQRLEVYLQVKPILALDGKSMSDLPSGKVGGNSLNAMKIGWLAATLRTF